jgi:hypothetical protein
VCMSLFPSVGSTRIGSGPEIEIANAHSQFAEPESRHSFVEILNNVRSLIAYGFLLLLLPSEPNQSALCSGTPKSN